MSRYSYEHAVYNRRYGIWQGTRLGYLAQFSGPCPQLPSRGLREQSSNYTFWAKNIETTQNWCNSHNADAVTVIGILQHNWYPLCIVVRLFENCNIFRCASALRWPVSSGPNALVNILQLILSGHSKLPVYANTSSGGVGYNNTPLKVVLRTVGVLPTTRNETQIAWFWRSNTI